MRTLVLSSSVVLAALAVAGCGRSSLSPSPNGPTEPDGSVPDSGPGTCSSNADCDDGLACNGLEQCAGGTCVPGPPPVCDDGVACTIDRCQEAAGGCISVPDSSRCPPGTICEPSAGGCFVRPCSTDAECDDGRFCNGREHCVAGSCAGGARPTCEDGPCGAGHCDLALDMCVDAPVDADLDGFPAVACGGNDCDDTNRAVHPGARELCSNLLDDDCNGATDCEDPTCGGDPGCGCAPFEASCTDERDNDCDGLTDCGDSECAADPICAACDLIDLGSAVGDRVASGSTIGRPNALVPSCRPTSTAGEQAFLWTAPTSGTYVFTTVGSSYDTVLYLLASCPGSELPGMCNDDAGGVHSTLSLRMSAGQRIVIVVDGFASRTGDYVLGIRSPTSAEICNDGRDNDGDGLADCADSDCASAPGCCTPTFEICNNGVDDDCDGLLDCADTSCRTSPECCTPSPEVCANGIDDDCDGAVDCADFDCRTSPSCCTPRPEICNNVFDDDCDGAVDCADFDCRTSPVCCVPRPEVCDNGVDDDCDGLRDCLDPTCRTSPSCCTPAPEVCNNVFDDDCDGAVDCADLDCRTSPSCCTPRPEICNNAFDDDCDGAVDCVDFDCRTSPSCCTPRPEVCNNVFDDDCDGAVDCADPDCATSPACCVPSPEICTNGRDDDCDLLVDCGDPSCASSPACCVPIPEVCNDGVDQDCDGLADCADPDCRAHPACCVPRMEVCNNLVDDDCDLRVDCGDPDCAGAPACCVPTPEICNDGADQDCDGLIDCADADCATAPICRPCPDHDLGSRLGTVATGTTVGMGDDVDPTCATSNAPDVTFRWTAPFTGDFIIDTNGSSYDTLLGIFTGCGGTQLACDDDSGTLNRSQIRMRFSAGQSVLIAVDGWGSSSGSFVLNIAGLIGGESNCSDGMDNDFDGDVDCADSDCAGEPSCAP